MYTDNTHITLSADTGENELARQDLHSSKTISLSKIEEHKSNDIEPFETTNIEGSIRNDEQLTKSKNEFDTIIFNFLTKLHAEPSLSRKTINEIFNNVKKEIVDPILNYITDESTKDAVNDAFRKYDSFYKFKKNLNEQGKFHDSDQRIVSNKIGLTFKNGIPTYDKITEKITLMPIQQQIQNFFELPNVLTRTIDLIKKFENEEDKISNFVQGNTWKIIKKSYQENDIVIPLFLYHDDFEADNPLSSNAGNSKIAAFYYSFPIIPQYLLSSPKYIHEALLFPSSLKNEGLEILLYPLIEIFKELEEKGIIVNIDGKEIKIYIVLSLIIGDNLAVNELTGFSKSFNSKYFCRFCITPKDDTNFNSFLKPNSNRIISDYGKHLELKEYGVKENCYFTQLKNFHPVTNYSCDIMHDVFEGIARYDVALILNYIIFEKKIFNLFTMNNLKQGFDYGFIEIGNLGPEIQESQIKNGYITMSASEMKTFLHFLPLMIGHMILDKAEHTDVWNLLLILIKIVDIILQSSLTQTDISRLKILISSYLKCRLKIFPDKNLKPKHHFLLHYIDCIENSGPLRHFMSFNYEQKNRIVKKYSKVSHQRINLPYSLSYKCLMSYNNFLNEHSNGFPSLYNFKKNFKLNYDELTKKEYFSNTLFDESWNIDDIFSLKYIKYKSTLFKIGFNIALKNDVITCYKIIDILQKHENYFLILNEIEILEYSEQMLCYFIGDPKDSFEIYELKNFDYFPFNVHQIQYNNKKAFRLKMI